MSFFGFGQSVEVEIVLSDAESRKRAEHKTEDGKKEKYFLFYDGETVSGKVSLSLKHPNKRLEHQGIKIEFIGQIGKSVLRAFLPGCVCQPGAHSGLVGGSGQLCRGLWEPLVPSCLRPDRLWLTLRYRLLCQKRQHRTRGVGAEDPGGVPTEPGRGGYPAPECSRCYFNMPLSLASCLQDFGVTCSCLSLQVGLLPVDVLPVLLLPSSGPVKLYSYPPLVSLGVIWK